MTRNSSTALLHAVRRRPRATWPAALAALAAFPPLGACLSSEDIDLGRDVDASAIDAAGPATTAASGDAGSLPLMSAAISASTGTICAGQCVDLQATASGGTAPYTYSWGQNLGDGAGPKSVCPAATTTYSVTVGSSASDALTIASAVVDVVECADEASTPAGPDAAGAVPVDDSGTVTTTAQSLCTLNPSFEGTPVLGGTGGNPVTPPTATPPDWQACAGMPNIDPSVSLVPASDGKTYVGLPVGSGTFSGETASIGTTLCASLQAGDSYSFCLDVGVGVHGVTAAPAASAPVLQLWGGDAPCKESDLLWASPPITNTDSWTQVCGTIIPSQTVSNIVLAPAGAAASGTGGLSYVIVDHIVAGP